MVLEHILLVDDDEKVLRALQAALSKVAPIIMFSTEGGMDIESVPSEKIATMTVDVLRGFRLYDALNLCVKLKVSTQILPSIAQAVMGLYQTFKGYNCRTAEINPLIQTKEGKIIAGP
jgi:succinyl-CoA synthetase beta subunit